MIKRIIKLPAKVWHVFWKQSKKKKAAIIVVIVVILLIANSIFNKPDPTAQYQLEAASINSLTEYVSETGHITTAGVTPIYSTTTGIVEELYVKNGDLVVKDEPLFKVKATATKQQKDAALATYLQAKTALETAQAQELALQGKMFAEWEDFKELAETDQYENAENQPIDPNRNVPEFQIPQKEWLSAEASYKAQQQAVAQARVNMSAAWQAYQATQDSQVTAIFEGQVQNLAVTKGDQISIQTATTSFPALVLIQDNVNTTVKLSVGETDILKVKPGQSAQVEIDALPHKAYEAYVDRVDTIAVPSQGVVVYSIYVVLNEPDQNILAGMTADVDIVVESIDNVLTVPSSAVKPYEGGRAVRILNDQSQIEYVPVEIGARGEGLTQIISGIDEGTQVITALTNEQVQRSGGGGVF